MLLTLVEPALKAPKLEFRAIKEWILQTYPGQEEAQPIPAQAEVIID